MQAGDEAPRHHLHGDPSVGPKLFGDELGGQFGGEEEDVEDCLPCVEVGGVHVEIVEQVVGEGLGDVAPVELEGEEHQADPGTDAVIQLRGC